ncbi:nucleotide exchange factor GrpE [bacterium]|nr:nucleotide exchange factor GrpE [bacterium]MBU4361257.1 nucleotide exchange factor GrpE [bacterium]MBU4601664.1 nucleotide exchange factor GrpE [bacterium]MCG2762093.1 nucleotide exchange factor GrpE [Candidatus Atribacteria bacterium]MCG2821142.1 nucleotide exchange factor GrpE [Candidatus Atribacteria bacterium]
MCNKKDEKELQEKAKLTESKKYKSMNKEEIIRKIIEKEEALKNIEEELSETKKLVQEKDNLSKEYLKHLERLQADFDNYKKRQEKKQKEFIEFANEELINNLLSVLDNLERALDSTENEKDTKAIKEGINNTLKEFRNILNKEGVKPMQSIGHRFDPYKHEAVMRIDTNKYSEDTITEEFRKGYYIKSKVLRPAMVKVAVSTKEKKDTHKK